MYYVYRHATTKQLTVAQTQPFNYFYAYGPASFADCWAWVRRNR